jgi:ribonuclease HI
MAKEEIFIDGSCLDNGLPTARGGFAIFKTKYNGSSSIQEIECGRLRRGKQTNNRAELESMDQTLKWIHSQPNNKEYEIYTDSRLVSEGMNGQASRNANRDIWDEIEYFADLLVGRIKVNWIESQKDNTVDRLHILNNLCDKMAKIAANSLTIVPVKPYRIERMNIIG